MFNECVELEKQYYAWIKDANLDDRPFNVLIFMGAYDLINKENVSKFLKIFGGEQK